MTDLSLIVPGARIAYSLEGDASPTRIVAHGLTSSRAADDEGGFMPWRGLDHGVRTARFDARGHGESTGRTEPDDYLWSSLAGDLLALIDEISPHEPVDALGASMGTATILWAATLRPERFRRLVLVIPPTAWETRVAQGDGYRAAADLVERDGIGAWLAAAQALPTMPILAEGGWTMSGPAISDALLPSVLRGAAMADFPSPDAVTAIEIPTLLLPWDGDPGHPVSTSERLLELMPNARLELARSAADIRAWPGAIEGFLGE
jgi:pimeloyl-ACP methyl ester carboxylesterase